MDCRNSYKTYLSSQEHELPTRVVDVGESLDSGNVRLVPTKGAKDHYVALSHCWGGAISPALTAEALGPFQDSIVVIDVFQNYQDTITITRSSSFRFLRIDCLCIEQDSESDRENEFKRMRLVYRNSTVTTSAMMSIVSREGKLKSDHAQTARGKRQCHNRNFEQPTQSRGYCMAERAKRRGLSKP